MAASVSSSRLGSLPISRTRLIGRERQGAAARDFLLEDAVPLLTLTGPGGVGKTRLALALAAEVADHFADGVVWVDLAPLADPEVVAATVAAALELTLAADKPVADELIRYLRPQQILLMLDNCEHVLVATSTLVSALLAGCPALQVLATSRAPLRVPGEQVLPVPPLDVPQPGAVRRELVAEVPAVALFVQRARGADPHFRLTDHNAGALAEVCRRLDGLPLAIELAAARASMLSPAAMLALLSQRLQVLGPGPRAAPTRHRTLRDAIAWSYALLSPEEQAFYRALAVFAGGWTLEAAAVVSGLTVPEAFARLDALVDQSLVVRQSGADAAKPRFTMLETIRAFGLEQLAESGEEAASRDLHAEYFVALAEAAELHLHAVRSDQAGWMARMDIELGNLRAALEWLLEAGEGTRALRLLVGIEAFIGARPVEAEARRWTESALRLAADAPRRLHSRRKHERSPCGTCPGRRRRVPDGLTRADAGRRASPGRGRCCIRSRPHSGDRLQGGLGCGAGVVHIGRHHRGPHANWRWADQNSLRPPVSARERRRLVATEVWITTSSRQEICLAADRQRWPSGEARSAPPSHSR